MARAKARTRSGLRPVMAMVAPASASAQAALRAAPPLPAIRTVALLRSTILASGSGDGFGVGIGAAPFSGFAPDGIDGANAAGERIHEIEIAHDPGACAGW